MDGSRETVGARGIALFGEVLLVGVLVGVATIPVVTVLAAMGSGAVLVRELVDGQRTPTVRRFLALLAGSLRQPVVLLAPVALTAVTGLDVLALLAGLPGARFLGPVLLVVLTFGVVTGLRGAAAWRRPDLAWWPVLRAAAAEVPADWLGSLLLAGALVVLGVVVAQMPAFLVIAPGLLVMAAVAVRRRWDR